MKTKKQPSKSRTSANKKAGDGCSGATCSAVDDAASSGMNNESYNWDNYNDLTYAAWLVGRRISGKKTIKEYTKKQDGAACRVSEHPANWR